MQPTLFNKIMISYNESECALYINNKLICVSGDTVYIECQQMNKHYELICGLDFLWQVGQCYKLVPYSVHFHLNHRKGQ